MNPTHIFRKTQTSKQRSLQNVKFHCRCNLRQHYTSFLMESFITCSILSITGIRNTNEQTIIKSTHQTIIDGNGVLTLANIYKDLLKNEIRGLHVKHQSTTNKMFFVEVSISAEGSEAIVPILPVFLDEMVVLQIWLIVLKVKMHYNLCNQRLVCKKQLQDISPSNIWCKVLQDCFHHEVFQWNNDNGLNNLTEEEKHNLECHFPQVKFYPCFASVALLIFFLSFFFCNFVRVLFVKKERKL